MPKKRIDSSETTHHNLYFSAEEGVSVGVWGPPGGLVIFCLKKYSAHPSVRGTFFPDTYDETSRAGSPAGPIHPPIPIPFEKTLFSDFGPKFIYMAPKFKHITLKLK